MTIAFNGSPLPRGAARDGAILPTPSLRALALGGLGTTHRVLSDLAKSLGGAVVWTFFNIASYSNVALVAFASIVSGITGPLRAALLGTLKR